MAPGYHTHLKTVMVSAATNNLPRVAVVTAILFFLSICFEVTYLTTTNETDDFRFLDFLYFGGSILLFGAYYHALGVEFENHDTDGNLYARLKATWLIFNRPVGFMITNTLVLMALILLWCVGLFVLFPAIDEPGSAYLTDMVLFGTPVPFVLLAILWMAFPKWFFNSMPVSHDIRLYSPEVATALRRASLPTMTVIYILFLAATGSVVAVDLGIQPTGLIEILLSSTAISFSSVIHGLGFTLAMTTAARMAMPRNS